MPLPTIQNGTKQCQVLTKRARRRCLNLAAYGCRACRMRCAHKSRRSLRGADHPQYRNGNETKKARAKRSHVSAMFLYLRDIGDNINLFRDPKTRGRRPIQYQKLDLNDPKQMMFAISLTLRKD